MTEGGTEPAAARGSWSVPRENYGVLTTHTAAAARLEAERTARRLTSETARIGGVPLAELRSRARTELHALAQEAGTAPEGTASQFDPDAPLIATGHQPELFHPGVWAKNIAANAIARPWGSAAWNLVVDNDLQGRSSVTIPTGTREEPTLAELPFDTPSPPRPWEESRIASQELFATFGARLEKALAPWGVTPWGTALWPKIAGETATSLVSALVRLRQHAEREWGVTNLEHPLSRLSSTEAFRIFSAAILVDAGDFRDRHNRALGDYRRRHRIRSEAHPVAALQEREGAIESPFWVWRDGDSQRGRLFVNWSGRSAIELFRGNESLKSRSVRGGDTHAAVIELLRELEQEGWKVRTRALTTTLFARLILSDLFIHGIGGAKYDELTDDILRTFFSLEPPPFMVLTATLRLPLGDLFPARPEDASRGLWVMNDQRWNPERYLETPEGEGALTRKLSLAQSIGRDGSPERIQELRELRAAWRGQIEVPMSKVRQETLAVQRQLAANRRLASRDFAWPLHPRQRLETLWERLRERLGTD